MKINGWTVREVNQAAARASLVIGSPFEVRNVKEMGSRIQFVLRPGLTPWSVDVRGDLAAGDRETIPRGRRTGFDGRLGGCCYHAFGHFFQALFDINPKGIIWTAQDSYRGVSGFRMKAHPAINDSCDCDYYGIRGFHNQRVSQMNYEVMRNGQE